MMNQPNEMEVSKKAFLIVSKGVIGAVERDLQGATYPVLSLFHLERLELVLTCTDDPGLLA